MKAALRKVFLAVGFSEHSVWLLLRELRLLKVRLAASLSLRQRAAIGRARNARGLRVNLACGGFPGNGWIGIDSSFQSRADWFRDLRKGLPLADGACSHLFCEHFLEHLVYPGEARRFLAECHRVLEDGGVVRLIVPDGGRFARAYAEGDGAFLGKACPDAGSPMEALNQIFHGVPLGEHHYAYDFDTLARLLKSAGFRQVTQQQHGTGSLASELDRKDAARVSESLYVEAIR